MAGGRKTRERPNILITGTPGTGKTTTAAALAEATNLRRINVGDLVKQKNLHDGWDDEFDCYVINEDLVCDELEDLMEEGGNIVDHHSCDFFPERWFDHVVVLQTDNTVLYDRLTKRGYTGKKLSNNIECEIFQVLLEEAKESYKEDIVVALRSDCIDDINNNVSTLTDWVGFLAASESSAGENPFTPKGYLMRYWKKQISNDLPKLEFLLEKASPLSASQYAVFSKLVDQNTMSTQLPDFCSKANLFYFPDLKIG
ncbi:hypothetical protein ACS0TY_020425 [Phlomoides rotata]